MDFSPAEQQYYFAGREDQEWNRPTFKLGQHDTKRESPLNDCQYGCLLNDSVSFVTTPITNNHFKSRVVELASSHLKALQSAEFKSTSTTSHILADPIVPPLTTEDTGLFPSQAVSTYVAYVSPWIELGSMDPVIAAISRQVLNLEIAYAGFCGIQMVVIPGPCGTAISRGQIDLAQHARAVKEALLVGSRLLLVVQLAMWPDIGSFDPKRETLAGLAGAPTKSSLDEAAFNNDRDFLVNWEAWHLIRSVCNYSKRLSVSLEVSGTIPDTVLVSRWLAEPLTLVVLTAQSFSTSPDGKPLLSKLHQSVLFTYMKLRNAPWILLSDIGPETPPARREGPQVNTAAAPPVLTEDEFPALGSGLKPSANKPSKSNMRSKHLEYLCQLEQLQPRMPRMEAASLSSYQDWLQPPLQPLADNLDSAVYEVFEGDPVKYERYETAITEALSHWKQNNNPTSSSSGAVVIAVAGSGRGPLVSRVLRASKAAGVPVQVWAVEKNPSAYVYLLRQNQMAWKNKVTVVKTDMRAWKGPLVSGTANDSPIYGKVDILVSELLGSFGDNELSPECLDGIQHVLARPHGISIPQSYTAHLSPIATPRIYAELLTRTATEPHALDTPWVVRLFQTDHVARKVPGHPRYQQAWEFSHPIPDDTLKLVEVRRSGGTVGGGGGSMAGATGTNDHNSRYCQLKFVCPVRGVIHGLAGYFEAILFASTDKDKAPVELSILPEQINHKSQDMVSWFPIFFPLKRPLSFPDDTELTVSMWRQTDDSKVWYEWLVDVHVWVGPKTKIKVASSDLCSSRKVACLL